jgi:hypothetical protein
MKFSTAWAEVANQNLVLKIALSSVSVCALCFAVITMKLALKEPIVIERACYSKQLKIADPRRTNEEIEEFVRLALEQRFDTEVKSRANFISLNEMALRAQEQKELASRQLKQRIVVNSIQIDGSSVTVDADRLITVSNVRSALALPLKLKVESQERTDGNPYGLLLITATATDKKGTQ